MHEFSTVRGARYISRPITVRACVELKVNFSLFTPHRTEKEERTAEREKSNVTESRQNEGVWNRCYKRQIFTICANLENLF